MEKRTETKQDDGSTASLTSETERAKPSEPDQFDGGADKSQGTQIVDPGCCGAELNSQDKGTALASPQPEQGLAEIENNDSSKIVKWRTSLGHRLLTLAGVAMFLFGRLFIGLMFDGSGWFAADLSVCGIPTMILMLVVSHFILIGIESPRGCKLTSLIWKGKPAICYRKWFQTDSSGITYGIKHVRWEVMDEIELSWFGNLVIRSGVISGPACRPDVILKIPSSAGVQDGQKELIKIARRKKPNIVLNQRLQKSVNSPVVRGQAAMQLVFSAIMIVVLFDVAFSLFYYLELLKNYYVANVAATAARGEIYKIGLAEGEGKRAVDQAVDRNIPVDEAEKRSPAENLKIANQSFERAEYMRTHPFPLSWISSKFLHGTIWAGDVARARVEDLWLLGEKEKAIEVARKSLVEQPIKSSRMQLSLVRMLARSGQREEAVEVLKKTIEDHKGSLLPRLYLLALKREASSPDEMKKAYREQLDGSYENTFGIEPRWPLGSGDRPYGLESWYSPDERFLLDRFLQTDSGIPMREIENKTKSSEANATFSPAKDQKKKKK